MTIHDPYYPERTSLEFYAGKVLGSVLFEPADDLSAITITVSAEMRVCTPSCSAAPGTRSTMNA